MDAAEIFKDRVRRRLDDLGMTHAELARRLGVSSPNVSQMLGKKTIVPRADTLKRWAEALDTTPQWLLGTETDEPLPAPPRPPNDIEILRFLLKALKLSPKQKEAIELALTASEEKLDSAIAALKA